jgi:hypothetical protein
MGAQYSTPKINGVFKSKTMANTMDKRDGKCVAWMCRKY